MSTIYYDIECDFTQIPNHIILNSKISGTAKAIYFYIVMRLRQNPKWEFYDFDIMEHLKEGRDSFRNAKKELLEYGYLVKVKQNIGNDGKYKGCDYAIKKEPITENPTSAKPNTDEPTSEIQSTNNKKQSNNINNKQSKKETNTASGFSNKKEIPTISILKNVEPTCKENLQVESVNIKEHELKTKNEIRHFVENYDNRIFNDLETDLITEYILKRKEVYKSKVKNTKQALTGLLNNIIATRKQFPLEWIFEVENGCYKRTATSGDATKPFQTIKPEYYKTQQNKINLSKSYEHTKQDNGSTIHTSSNIYYGTRPEYIGIMSEDDFKIKKPSTDESKG